MQAPDELTLYIQRLTALDLPYMVTGATAAIVYGQPRVTNDLDIVLALDVAGISKLVETFPETDFYLPPTEVIRSELTRAQRGHLNIIHHESGYKADVYLVGRDPLHRWALPLRRMIAWTEELTIQVAPPEYVIIRKMEYYREGGSSKHPADIRTILSITDVDHVRIGDWATKMGLSELWSEIQSGPGR